MGSFRHGTQWGLASEPVDDWRELARCRDADPELFFPTGIGVDGDAATSLAVAFCWSCPVRVQCLSWALGNGEHFGVWGGTTPAERRRMGMTSAPPVMGDRRRPIRDGKCIHGHPLTVDNTYVDARGHGHCRRCRADKRANWRSKQREAVSHA